MPGNDGLLLHSAAFGVKGQVLDTHIDEARFHILNDSSSSADSNRSV